MILVKDAAECLRLHRTVTKQRNRPTFSSANIEKSLFIRRNWLVCTLACLWFLLLSSFSLSLRHLWFSRLYCFYSDDSQKSKANDFYREFWCLPWNLALDFQFTRGQCCEPFQSRIFKIPITLNLSFYDFSPDIWGTDILLFIWD